MSDSLEKASLWGSFRAFPLAFPPFTSCKDVHWACHQCLLPPLHPALGWAHLGLRNGTDIFCLPVVLGWEVPVPTLCLPWPVAGLWWTSPEWQLGAHHWSRSCREYRSSPQDLGRQAHKATQKGSMKAWQSHPFAAFASCSNANTLSQWACWRVKAMLWLYTSTSLMASVAWTSFRHARSSVFSFSSLWQKSMVALFVSNCSRDTFISPAAEGAHLRNW